VSISTPKSSIWRFSLLSTIDPDDEKVDSVVGGSDSAGALVDSGDRDVEVGTLLLTGVGMCEVTTNDGTFDAEASGLDVVKSSDLVGTVEPSSVPRGLGLLVLASLLGLSVPTTLGAGVGLSLPITSGVGVGLSVPSSFGVGVVSIVGREDFPPTELGSLDKLNASGFAVGTVDGPSEGMLLGSTEGTSEVIKLG
jgi:hypothetical protein